jgi:hypothetical protein
MWSVYQYAAHYLALLALRQQHLIESERRWKKIQTNALVCLYTGGVWRWWDQINFGQPGWMGYYQACRKVIEINKRFSAFFMVNGGGLRGYKPPLETSDIDLLKWCMMDRLKDYRFTHAHLLSLFTVTCLNITIFFIYWDLYMNHWIIWVNQTVITRTMTG